MTQLAINVLGMTCEHCAARVRDALGQLPDVKVSRVDHEEGLATIESGRWYAPEAFEKAVGDAGYHFAGASVMDEVTIPVGGMHCNNCARKVNNELAVVSGVKRVDVDLDGERVTVTGRAHLGEMIDAIRRAGFTVGEPPAQPDVPEVVDVAGGEPESGAACPVQLNLSGMSCASCVSTVERALSGVPGVERASVNFADQSAYVVTRGDSAALVDAVKRAGYGASIRQDDDLESRDAELAARLRSTYIKSGVALALGAALMGTMQFNLLPTPDATAFWLGVSAVVLAAMAYAGGHFFVGAVSSARHGAMTMDTLIALGTGTAFIYSFLIIVAPELVPPASRHLFFEAAVFIIGFINLGKGFEDNAKGKTSLAVKKLIGLAPKSASRIREGDEEETVPIEQVVVGDRLRIRPGETIPVDGVVESGNGSVDESMLTGESVPVDKTDGAKLVAGTLVMNGTLVMIAKQVGGETVLARMIDLVRDAQNSKPAIGRLTDRIASVFVPAVIAIALATGVAWYLVGPEPKVSYVVVTMMSVLIIACPCALGLAIPMSIMVGMGRAASAGMLIKNSEALQAAARLTLIVVDKTGTLTAGRPRVTRVWAQDDETGMLSLAGALEKLSEHPLARAVVQYVQEQGIGETTVSDFSMTSGGGVTGTLDGQTVAVGNPNYLKSLGMSRRFDAQPEGGSTAIYVGRGHEVL
ncbi:MAG: heavy metal translocating P-type ATPase, partial [Pseudomonadales bacterium]|nr:heavy metal translocating P-type ATPase [Pseudomonadales bacterium]